MLADRRNRPERLKRHAGIVARPDLELPISLVDAAREEGRDEWLASVPATVTRFCAEWSLTVEPPFQPGGCTAWVAPARSVDGAELALKVAWRHAEAEHEPDGLQVWAGDGAVVLHRFADLDDTLVLLLERCMPGAPLSEQPETRQDEVIAALLRRLWVTPPAGGRFRPLAEMCTRWAAQFEAKRATGQVTLDPGLAREGIDLFTSLPRSAAREVLLVTDLHAGNVLASQREPWLVVDPKPYVGDPTYDALQHMLNCPERLHADPSRLVARLADLLGLDGERLRLWLLARCVQESLDYPQLGEVARQLAGSVWTNGSH